MDPEVSRILARFVTGHGIGQEAARELAAEFGSASVVDLPEWLTEAPTMRESQ